MVDLNPISGLVQGVGSAVEKVAGVFTTNAENDAKRSADEQMALLKSYQAEFHDRQNRTWIDALADGFNRLVRPVIVTIVVSIFIIAYINPSHFAEITLALSSIPSGYWALLSVIIGFYFGGRMQLKAQDFQFKQSQAQAVQALVQTRKEFRQLEMDDDEPDRAVGDTQGKDGQADVHRNAEPNKTVQRFLKLKKDNPGAAVPPEAIKTATAEAKKDVDDDDIWDNDFL